MSPVEIPLEFTVSMRQCWHDMHAILIWSSQNRLSPGCFSGECAVFKATLTLHPRLWCPSANYFFCLLPSAFFAAPQERELMPEELDGEMFLGVTMMQAHDIWQADCTTTSMCALSAHHPSTSSHTATIFRSLLVSPDSGGARWIILINYLEMIW